ncbi:MAG: NAD(P)H-flavin reductase [Gammaproteobacteria bacterium]
MDSTTCICEIDLIKPLTDKIILLLLQPSGTRFQYIAGQYIEIITADGQHMPFSIANAPLGSKQLELHIRHTTENTYSNYLLNEIKRTGKIKIRGPFGHCIYHPNTPKTTLLMAGGTGFAPIKAIIEQVLAEGDNTPKHLYWGAKNMSDLYLDELPRQWQKTVPHFRYTPVLPETGLIYEIIAQDYPSLTNHQVYAAGPPDMIFSALENFQKLGLEKKFMYSDAII